MKLILFSDDKFLYDTLKHEFNDILLGKSFSDMSDNDVIIFDTIDEKNIMNCLENIKSKDNKLIININDFSIDGLNNIIKPFRIGSLVDKISDFYEYSKTNIFTFPIGVINKNRQTLTINDKTLQFTGKELEFLIQISINGKSKEELLGIVWNSKSQENNVVETTVYNIRQKLSQNEVEDFIICKNGIYSIS